MKCKVSPSDVRGKWISASDYRFMDHLASAIAKQLYSDGYLNRLERGLGQHIKRDLATSEVISACAEKIKHLLLFDSCEHNKPTRRKMYLKALLAYRIREEIKAKKSYEFKRSLSLTQSCLSPIITRMFGILFFLKAISFYFAHLKGIIFNRSNNTILDNDIDVIIGDDSLLSGVGNAYAKVLSIMDPSNTLIFSPEVKLEKKIQFSDKNFNAYDVDDLRSMVSVRQYYRVIIKDAILLINTISSIWARPEFSLDLYKFMVRVMTWRLFGNIVRYSRLFKFMVRPTQVDSHFSRMRNAKLCFIYFSITPNPISPRNGKIIYGNLDYSDMNIDYLLCDSISYKMFSALNNGFNHVVIKPFNSSTSLAPDVTRQKRIIFMDNTWGFAGVNSLDSMLRFFEMVVKVSKIGEFDVKVKVKKNNIRLYQSFIDSERPDQSEKFKIIRSEIASLTVGNLSSSECMQAADLIISSPLSSVIYEGISSRRKVLVYDPLAECKNNGCFVDSLGGAYCIDDASLISSLRVALSDSFDDYIRINCIKLLQFQEFRDVSSTSPLLLRNAIKRL